MPNKRKNNSSSQSDFKRIKAKVGKRAPKSLNVTDTTFQSASLHVSEQSIGHTSNASTLFSSRGKSIYDLSSQLSHHAPAMRLSAIKGLGNIARNQDEDRLRPFLSTLIPAFAKSWVDEDSSVREAGLDFSRDILHQQNDAIMRPFLPLIVAHSSSAIHSLDFDMRVDGSRSIHLVCSLYPKLMESFVSHLLRPYIGLLGDRGKLKSSYEILRGFVSLLATFGHGQLDQNYALQHFGMPDVDFTCGGRSRNCLLLGGRLTRRQHVSNASDQIHELNQTLWKSSQSKQNEQDESVLVGLELLGNLQNLLVEFLDEEISRQTSKDSKQSNQQMREDLLLLVLQAIKLLWVRLTRQGCVSKEGTGDKLLKVATNILSILLEALKGKQEQADLMETPRLEQRKSIICGVVVALGNSIPSISSRNANSCVSDWLDSVSAFLLPRLQQYANKGDCTLSNVTLFCDMLQHSYGVASLHESKQDAMLEALQNVFFDDFQDSAVLRSKAHRTSVLAIIQVVRKGDDSLDFQKPFLAEMISHMPNFLYAWSTEFVFESHETLRLLHDVAIKNESESGWLQLIRDGLSKLVYDSNSRSRKPNSTIFEQFPMALQRQYLSAIVALGKPTDETLKGLSLLCLRAPHVPNVMIDEIFFSIQSLRKSMSLKSYLQFLLKGINIHLGGKNHSRNKSGHETFQFHDIEYGMKLSDHGLKRVAQALLQCGSAKSLEMISQVLSSLLERKASLSSAENFLRNRVGLSIIAILGLDIANSNGKFNIPRDLDSAIKESIFRTCTFVVSSKDSQAESRKLLRPITAIFEIVPKLIVSFMTSITGTTGEKASNKTRHALVKVLLDMLSNQRVALSFARAVNVDSVISAIQNQDDLDTTELVVHLKACSRINQAYQC